MADRIYLISGETTLTPLVEQAYDSEDLLQRLLANHGDILAGDQMSPSEPRRWLLVKREMGVSETQEHQRGGHSITSS